MAEGPVVVVGATGQVGEEVCRRFRARGEEVRALVRATSDPEAKARLEALGVDCRDGQVAVVDAAERAGIERVVFISFPEAVRDHPFQQAKRAVERRLRAAGLEHVILHPEKFMDVWFTPPLGFDLDGRVRLYGGGEAPQAWVAAADVAEVAVQAVRLPGLRNETVQFGGPEALSQLQVVEIFERLLGRSIETEVVSRSDLEEMFSDAPTPTVESIAGVLLEATEPSGPEWPAFAETLQLRRTSVAEFAAAHTPTREGDR
jgi:uncharacterized protein YbjT (DUF2867 family)